jgi:F0F1-type ATP synthase assembly protein I
MKTFLKVSLIVVLSLLAIKFVPFVFLGAMIGLLIAALLGVLGLSLIAALLAVAVGLALALAPIWIPVLIVMGAISLFKKLNERSAPPVIAA